jgi:extracellular elastinolytic metalloproteinase
MRAAIAVRSDLERMSLCDVLRHVSIGTAPEARSRVRFMSTAPGLTQLLSVTSLSLAACTGVNDMTTSTTDRRDQAVQELQRQAGAPVTVEVGATGDTRILATTPRFPVPGHATDPAVAAMDFLVAQHDLFQLDDAEASHFALTSEDHDPITSLHHITLNRTYNGILVFQGGITIHMDNGNNVYRAVGDEAYHIDAPTNRMMLSASEAARAAGHALGVELSPVLAGSDDPHAVFTSAGALDLIHVDQTIVHVARGDDRFAYQATVSWSDEAQQQQYQLALIDAQDGSLLGNYSLVNTFTGRAFVKSPGARPTGDTREPTSCNGNPAASPLGWVGPGRTTIGNNAVACTDLNGNNSCAGGNEIQPIADADGDFDFPFSPTGSPSVNRAAAVANAFFYVNNWHDLLYGIGFTESARNFQTSNFGAGGAQNDEVQIDVQDGSGLNNANFSTPPDGSKPRMQMFLFNLVTGTPGEDGDFDPSVVYHEMTHGLSNRVVGGGSPGCLGGIQSGGMGEGWSDYYAGAILKDPVIGAYVSGNATIGVREFSMANSPLTYANVKDGSHAEVHGAGEVWAATMWGIRSTVGSDRSCRIILQGMKNTPCNPTMLQARDGIIAADQQVNGGVNVCKLWSVFASRQMGFGASSPNHNSTSQIVLSTALPPECAGTPLPRGVLHNVTSTDMPQSIPDNNATGVSSVIDVPAGLHGTLKVTVDTVLTRVFRGDLVIQVISPTGEVATLSNRAGGSADSFVATGLDISASFTPTSSPSGRWRLFVRDLTASDAGTINSFALHITAND